MNHEPTARTMSPYPLPQTGDWMARHEITVADAHHIIAVGRVFPGRNNALIYQGTTPAGGRELNVVVSADHMVILSVTPAGPEPKSQTTPPSTHGPRPIRTLSTWMLRHRLSTEDLHHIMATGDSWPGYDGARIYKGHVPGHTAAYLLVVSADGEAIIGATTHDPKDRDSRNAPKGPRATPRVSGTKGDTRMKLPHEYGEFLQLLRVHGFELTQTKKHIKLTHPQHPGTTTSLPGTPSDSQAGIKNSASQIRTLFGIDLRQPPAGR